MAKNVSETHPSRSRADFRGEHEMPSVSRNIDDPAALSATISDPLSESPKYAATNKSHQRLL